MCYHKKQKSKHTHCTKTKQTSLQKLCCGRVCLCMSWRYVLVLQSDVVGVILFVGRRPQIYLNRDPRPIKPHEWCHHYDQPWGSIWRSSGVCRPPTQTMPNQCTHNLRMPCSILHMFYRHARNAVDTVPYAPDKPRLFLIMRKTCSPPN